MPSRVPDAIGSPSLSGDPRVLTARLGSPAILQTDPTCNPPSIGLPRDASALRQFVATYRDTILGPQELPFIIRARELAAEGCARELIQLDADWGATAHARPFAEASLAVGRRQLSRLRPLRDQRVVQRYAAAVEAGQAKGWHVIVYGMALAIFSVPLRPGLHHYATLTQESFIDQTPNTARLTDSDKAALKQELGAALPALLQEAVPNQSLLRVV